MSRTQFDSVKARAARRVAVCIRACVRAIRRGERVVPVAVRDGLTVGDHLTVAGETWVIRAGWRVRRF